MPELKSAFPPSCQYDKLTSVTRSGEYDRYSQLWNMMKLQILLQEFQFPLETFIKSLPRMLTHPRGGVGWRRGTEGTPLFGVNGPWYVLLERVWWFSRS